MLNREFKINLRHIGRENAELGRKLGTLDERILVSWLVDFYLEMRRDMLRLTNQYGIAASFKLRNLIESNGHLMTLVVNMLLVTNNGNNKLMPKGV